MKYRLSPHSACPPSRGRGSAVTAYPRGSNSRRRNPSPPRHGSTESRASNGIARSASSCRLGLRPPIAEPSTRAMATDRNDDATYGRSFTY